MPQNSDTSTEMSANSETPGLPAVPPPPPPPAPPQPPASPQRRPGRTSHRRTGTVALLPQATRDKINSGMDDGVPYQKIIDRLGPEGNGLTVHHLSEWKDGGYQDHLEDKFWREDIRSLAQTFTSVPAGPDPLKLPETGLQLAALGACQFLRDLATLETAPDGSIDPEQYVRVANSLARLSRSILTLQQYRDTTAKTNIAELKPLPPDRDLVQNERAALLDRADELFGFQSHQRPQPHDDSTPSQLSAPAASPPPENQQPKAPNPDDNGHTHSAI